MSSTTASFMLPRFQAGGPLTVAQRLPRVPGLHPIPATQKVRVAFLSCCTSHWFGWSNVPTPEPITWAIEILLLWLARPVTLPLGTQGESALLWTEEWRGVACEENQEICRKRTDSGQVKQWMSTARNYGTYFILSCITVTCFHVLLPLDWEPPHLKNKDCVFVITGSARGPRTVLWI